MLIPLENFHIPAFLVKSMSETFSSKWFVAQYKPNACFIAKKNLEKQGVGTFLPLVESTKRKTSRFLSELKPLFPGYIFISFNQNYFRWRTINSTIGLSRLLVFNDTPQPVPEDFIRCLKLRCDFNHRLLHNHSLETGSRVEVMKGPFTKMIGSIEKIDPKKRVTLLFEILGRKTSTNLSIADLKIVN